MIDEAGGLSQFRVFSKNHVLFHEGATNCPYNAISMAPRNPASPPVDGNVRGKLRRWLSLRTDPLPPPVEQSDDLVLNNRAVSLTHAGIKEISGEYWLFNLTSSHNTVLNGKPIEQAPIADGDVAEIRPYLLRLEKSQDGLRITVEIEADSIVSEDKATTGKLALMDARTNAETTRLPNDYIFALIGGEKPTKFLESLGVKVG